jgi:hypothetical protein
MSQLVLLTGFEVFREPKVKLHYQVEVRQVIALRPIAPANEGSEQ